MLIKRTVFNAVGVFDETLLTGGCDRDLVLRAYDAGFKMGRTPRAVVRHVISPHRITPDHLKWYSLQFGSSFAYIDWKRWRRWKTVLACLARIGQALVVNLPLLFFACLRGPALEGCGLYTEDPVSSCPSGILPGTVFCPIRVPEGTGNPERLQGCQLTKCRSSN